MAVIVAICCNVFRRHFVYAYQTTIKPLMKKILLSLCGLLLLASAFGQTTELAVSLNSGLFSFAGRSATSSSFINYSPSNPSYTNDPYGSRSGLSYGLSATIKRVIHRHLLIGVDAGYEDLRSKVAINSVSEGLGYENFSVATHGQTILTSRFIALEPFLGYRFTPGKVNVDLTGGVDLAHCLSARENGKAEEDNGISYHTSVDRKTISTDLRPRVQVSAGYRRAFVYVGYSFGVSNYMTGYIGGPAGAYGRLFRFGIGYRLL